MLAQSQELDNIRLACKRAGISKSRPADSAQTRMPNQTPPEIEDRILKMTGQFPTYSYIRISH